MRDQSRKIAWRRRDAQAMVISDRVVSNEEIPTLERLAQIFSMSWVRVAVRFDIGVEPT